MIDRTNSTFYINGTRVPGLNSINFDVNSQASQLEAIGFDSYANVRSSYPTASISLSRVMTEKDFVYDQYSGIGFNGNLLLNNQQAQNVSFVSGYLTNYSINIGLNEPPVISANITAYRSCGNLSFDSEFNILGSGLINVVNNAPAGYSFCIPAKIVNGAIYKDSINPKNFISTGDLVFENNNYFIATGIYDTSHSDPSTLLYKQNKIRPISSKSIKLRIDDTRNNRLINCSLNFSLPKLTNYFIGSKFPFEVIPTSPISISCSLEFEPEDYTIFINTTYPESKIRYIKLDVFDIFGSYVTTWNLGNMELLSENYSVSKDGSAKISAQYIKV